MSHSAPPLFKAGPPGKAPPRPKAPGPKNGAPPPPGLAKRLAPQQISGPKLRPLFWTSVAQVPQDSVWSNLVEPAPFDVDQLALQFALKLVEPSRSRAQGTAAQRTASEERRKRLRVLDDRTSQLLSIAFNRLPPPEQLASVVNTLEGFPEALPAEAVLALHVAVTEQQEPIEQLRQLNVKQMDIGQLDMPERYLWVLGSVPASAAKLACGALIVGPAEELGDLRQVWEKVGVCCQSLRRSELIHKCISTSLAVGNCMNRGTSRFGARAVVLPDSLLKLDELRGVACGSSDETVGNDGRASSLLDFVAQALVNEPGARHPKELRAEVEELRAMARCAQTVSLEDAEASCNQVCAAAARASRCLNEIPITETATGLGRLAERVRDICVEADVAAKQVRDAKEELVLTQQWSCAKCNKKGDEWFTAWAQFLEQLAQAFCRAKSPPPPRQPAPTPRAALSEVRPQPNAPTPRAALSEVRPQPNVILKAPPVKIHKPVAFDDDAKAENFDIAAALRLMGTQQASPEAARAPQFDAKENRP